MVWLWQQIAERYKNTDPNRVPFELRNEPHDITAAAWRTQATQLVQTVRTLAPNHTLIVGFHDWNGRDATTKSEPFADPNVVYTFHFYDPFVFTHQGASWAGAGLPDLKGVPFPAAATKINVPASARGTWVKGAIGNYANEASYPNPARNAVRIVSTGRTAAVSVRITDVLGKYVCRTDLIGSGHPGRAIRADGVRQSWCGAGSRAVDKILRSTTA